MGSSDSESSSEDDLERFRESIDQQFLKDDLYTENSTKTKEPKGSKPNDGIEKLPSLRRNINEEDQALNFFRVTPEFQKYVAKQLSAKLEDELGKYEIATNIANNTSDNNKKKRKRGGIKLLHSSQHHLKVTNDTQLDYVNITEHNANIRRKNNDFDEDAIVEQCKLVAVNANDILSKKDVQMWSKRTKRDVHCYKKGKRGVLEYQERPFVSVTYK